MPTASAVEVQAYLDATYLSLEQLAERTGLAPERILELEAAQCIPGASYQVEGTLRITSTFGPAELALPERRFYHPSIARWAKTAEGLSKKRPLDQVARLMRNDFTRELTTIVNGREAPHSLTPEQAWAYVTDGTWGLCLKEIAPQYMVGKEMARATVAATKCDPDDLSPAERGALESAVADYEGAALPYAPHERPQSSRQREIEPAVEKYGLNPAAGGLSTEA